MACLESLREIALERLEAWREAACVKQASWVQNSAQLRIEYHFLRQHGPYWNVFCLIKLRMRSSDDLSIPYKLLAAFV